MTVTHTEPPGTCTRCGGNCQPRRPLCSYCREARRLELRDAAPAEPAPVVVPDQGPHAGSPYRCRDHHDVRVDRHGRGCPECPRSRR
jgi:hypothetical protein